MRSSISRSHSRCSVKQGSMSKFDKLYKRLTNNKKVNMSYKYKKHMKMRREMSKCKLKPEISRNSKRLGKIKNSGVPIYMRYNQELIKRESKLQNLKKSVEKQKRTKDPEPSFTPKINKKSRIKANKNAHCGDLSYNTRKFLKRKKEKINQVRDSMRLKENQELTFQPRINQRSSKIVKRFGVRIDRLIQRASSPV